MLPKQANWRVIEETRKVLQKTQQELEKTQKILKQTQQAWSSSNPQWLYKEPDGTWNIFTEDLCTNLELWYQSKLNSATYFLDTFEYLVNFQAMTLSNVMTGEAVEISRSTVP